MSASNNQKFTAKERQEIESLNSIINDRGASVNERQIAEAKLYDLEKSKEPAPHNHKHRIHDDESNKSTNPPSSNMFHNDEAFEKFAMGGEPSYNRESGTRHSKVQNQAAADVQAVKMNHKARGSAKERAEEAILNEEFGNFTHDRA